MRSTEITLIQADWPAPACVRTCVTTRQTGVSEGAFAYANMALHVGDDPQKVLQNRQQLTEQLQLTQPICWLDQQHTTEVVRAELWRQPPVADALWTDQPGLACAVMTADCLPVFFTTMDGQKVALAHAGWRGLLAGILENTVAALGVPAEQLITWFGPAIGLDGFLVGEEVRAAFIEQDPQAEQAFEASIFEDRWFGDIYRLARLRLARLGIAACYGGIYCSHNQGQLFYSYRRAQTTGRMASVIWIAE